VIQKHPEFSKLGQVTKLQRNTKVKKNAYLKNREIFSVMERN
jgi:hypothetical protein